MPLIQFGLKLAQPRGGKVVVLESVVNRVSGQLGHLQRQQHARRIDRIEKAVSVADQDEAVAGVLLRAIGVIEDRIDLIDALGAFATRLRHDSHFSISS